jgi:hypothetical protein
VTTDDQPTREVLVHLNLELPAEFPGAPDELAEQIEREIQGALDVGVDPDETPALHAATIAVALVDPI